MVDLYVMDSCPYCQKVMNFADDMDIKYDKFEVDNSENHNRLIMLGGKDQVPFLVDGETKMYESSDIIEYLRNKKERS